MATDAPRAPRMVRAQTSMADAAAVHRQALHGLGSFRFNDVKPFDGTGRDLAQSSLEKAHAVAIALGIALERGEDDQALRAVHAARVVDAIGALISLAAFGLEGVHA